MFRQTTQFSRAHERSDSPRGGVPSPAGSTIAPLPTHDQIAARAFDIYVAGGRQPGQCDRNWLQAERELISEAIEAHESQVRATKPPPIQFATADAPQEREMAHAAQEESF